MKKLINRPEAVVEEMIEGLVAVYPGLERLPGETVLVRADRATVRARQVALISGGGSGHEPAHAGYVGRGMLSAAVAGDVFTSPSPDAVLAALRAVTGPPGALLIVKNYTGDRLNFGLAAELARAEGLSVETVIVADDAALAATAAHAGRRGLAGAILVHKIAGAAAEAGCSLAEVAAEARAAAASVGTMGVALAPCTIPAAGAPGFTLGDREVELGLGIHGEPGVRRVPLEPADALVDQLLDTLTADVGLVPGARVALLVNGLGGTPLMELAIVARRARIGLEARGIVVERAYLGTFLSALEMAGVSLTVLRVDEARLARLDAATDAPAWPNAPAAALRPLDVAATAGAMIATGPTPTRHEPPRTRLGRALGAALRAGADALLANEARLTDLDRQTGDGDLGISLARGAEAIGAALDSFAWPLDESAATFHALGLTLQRTLGGTSGALYAVFFLGISASLRSTAANDPKTWGAAFESGCAALATHGGAEVGDRTMLDALVPAVNALQGALYAVESLHDALGDVGIAAEAGARATATMLPRRGRSSYLGARVVGHPDPGAEAVAAWVWAVAASVQASLKGPA